MSLKPNEAIPTEIVEPSLPCLKCFNEGRASLLSIRPASSHIEGLIDGKCAVCGYEMYNYSVLRYINRPDFDAIRKENARRNDIK